jgi:hypothetical protein
MDRRGSERPSPRRRRFPGRRSGIIQPSPSGWVRGPATSICAPTGCDKGGSISAEPWVSRPFRPQEASRWIGEDRSAPRRVGGVFRAEGPGFFNPAHRAGFTVRQHPSAPQRGARTGDSISAEAWISRPFRPPWKALSSPIPGRCPGLRYGGPSGLKKLHDG